MRLGDGEAKARAFVLLALGLAIAVGFTWGLPGPDTWCVDSISPRSCGLGAIAETYTPGHFHTYPPLHMALLTVLSLPWMLVAALRAGTGMDALAAELVKPLYMTGIELSARAVAGVMALAIAWNTMRLWARIGGTTRAGILAGAVLVTNATLVYYAHTGNLEVPYLFWVTWALVEIDRVADGEPRERQAILLATAAALTKDQAAAVLMLPLLVYVVLVPWFSRRAPITRRSLLVGIAYGIVVYAVASGALVNPSGFRRRLDFLFGPGSQTWAQYPRGVDGMLAWARDALAAVTHFSSWPLVAVSILGAVLVWPMTRDRLARARLLLPLVAAASFTVFFNLGARRSEDRFLLPQSVLLLPYAALALDRAWVAWGKSTRGKALVAGVGALALASALLGVVSMDATLVADPRYAGERYLATLPAGARIEAYGSAKYLPRLPPQLVAIHPGVEPLEDRQQMGGVTELVDPMMDPRPRAPDAIVLATELSNVEMTEPPRAPGGVGLATYRDPVTRAFLRGLLDGSLGYTRVLRAECKLPWPLECRSVHGSTAGEVWIYAPAAP